MQNKEFYLTFDGAVNPPGTLRILEVLKKHNVLATFFVEGHRIAGHENILRQMRDAGHHVGNHSFTHPDFSTISPEECLLEVQKTDEALFSALNLRTRLLRPPCGILPDDRCGLLEQEGYKICLWSISVKDWEGPDAQAVAQRTFELAREPAVTAVYHDHLETTADTVDILIPGLQNMGYDICPIPYI